MKTAPSTQFKTIDVVSRSLDTLLSVLVAGDAPTFVIRRQAISTLKGIYHVYHRYKCNCVQKNKPPFFNVRILSIIYVRVFEITSTMFQL